MREFKMNYPAGLEVTAEVKDFFAKTLQEHAKFISGGFENHLSATEVDKKVADALNEYKQTANKNLASHKEEVSKLLPINLEDHKKSYITKLVKFDSTDTNEMKKEKIASIAKSLNYDLGGDFQKVTKEPQVQDKPKERTQLERTILNNL